MCHLLFDLTSCILSRHLHQHSPLYSAPHINMSTTEEQMRNAFASWHRACHESWPLCVIASADEDRTHFFLSTAATRLLRHNEHGRPRKVLSRKGRGVAEPCLNRSDARLLRGCTSPVGSPQSSSSMYFFFRSPEAVCALRSRPA